MTFSCFRRTSSGITIKRANHALRQQNFRYFHDPEPPGSNLAAEAQPKTEERTKAIIDVEDEALDKGWSWFVVLGFAIVHLLLGGLERCDGIFYQEFVSCFHSGASETAWVSSIAATLRVLLGLIKDRIGTYDGSALGLHSLAE